MWIDTNDCREGFHEIKRNGEGDWAVYHVDGSECEESEFNLRELAA